MFELDGQFEPDLLDKNLKVTGATETSNTLCGSRSLSKKLGEKKVAHGPQMCG